MRTNFSCNHPVINRRLDDNGEELHGSAARGVDETEVVYLVDDRKAALRQVVTGISDQLYVEISGGLEEEDEVVIGPYRTLKDLRHGEAVRIKEPQDEDDEEAGRASIEVELG